MRLQTIAILFLTLAGFALRLHYLTTTHPFFDEYTTVLASRQVLQYGWPLLPSGLFYEHGLLATYLIAPFTALFITLPLDQWQPAHWGLMLSRWPSTLISTATIPLIYTIGRHLNIQQPISNPPSTILHPPSSILHLPASLALLAAGLFAFSPEGMVWGGRARMYALATMLGLLIVMWAYRGALYPAPARYRWWAMAALLAALLTQLAVVILIPALIIAMLTIGWLSHRQANRQGNQETLTEQTGKISYASERSLLWGCLRAKPPLGMPQSEASSGDASRLWFLRPSIIPEALALAVIVGIGIWIKRLGQPVGMAALGSEESGDFLNSLLNTITYQTALSLSGPATLDFLAEQFGPPHLFWLTLVAVAGVVVSGVIWLISRWQMSASLPSSPAPPPPRFFFNLFPGLIFGLILLEMIALLDPFRQNPRYLVMFLPLFYLIAANAIMRCTLHVLRFTPRSKASLWGASRLGAQPPFGMLHASRLISPLGIALALLTVFTALNLPDLRIALVTPEPAYELAFKLVNEEWQQGDALFTMNTPAAALYHSRVDGFTVQTDADQFLLNKATTPVDRWVGVPWVGAAADFNAALNAHQRAWFVIDTIRQPVYFRADWQAVVNSQMEPVLSQDNVLVYRTRPGRIPLPTEPESFTQVTLDEAIELIGYTLQISAPQPVIVKPNSPQFNLEAPVSALNLTLFWQPLRALAVDYTVFLHLRNYAGATVAQFDGLSLNGTYPTSRWQPGEMVIDPFILALPADLPPGHYTLWAGMYELETLERLPVTNDPSGENAILLGEINYQ